MILLRKIVVLEVGVQGVKEHPHKFRFAENLDKILEIPGKNGAQRRLTSKIGAQGLQKNTRGQVFWRNSRGR